MNADITTWDDARERVKVLLADSVEHLEESFAELSHLNIIRRFMYSTNAMSRWIRWIWITSELIRPDEQKVSALVDATACIEVIRKQSTLIGVAEKLDWWIMTLNEGRCTLPKSSEFNMEAFATHRNMLGDIIRSPLIGEAEYEPGEVPAVSTRLLELNDGSVYYADGEELDDRPTGEVALIAGARLARMHTRIAELMDDAMGADGTFVIARLRLKFNSELVKAYYNKKLAEGTRHGKDNKETAGSQCPTNHADRRIA